MPRVTSCACKETAVRTYTLMTYTLGVALLPAQHAHPSAPCCPAASMPAARHQDGTRYPTQPHLMHLPPPPRSRPKSLGSDPATWGAGAGAVSQGGHGRWQCDSILPWPTRPGLQQGQPCQGCGCRHQWAGQPASRLCWHPAVVVHGWCGCSPPWLKGLAPRWCTAWPGHDSFCARRDLCTSARLCCLLLVACRHKGCTKMHIN